MSIIFGELGIRKNHLWFHKSSSVVWPQAGLMHLQHYVNKYVCAATGDIGNNNWRFFQNWLPLLRLTKPMHLYPPLVAKKLF